MRLPVGLLATFLMLLASVAEAVDADPEAFKGWIVRDVAIDGVEADLGKPLRKGLALSGSGGIFGGDKARFYPDLLEQDRRRILLYLSRNGYPRARVDIGLEPVPSRDELRVRFRIRTGEPVLVQSVDVAEWPATLDPVRPGDLPLRPGIRFREEGFDAADRELLRRLRRGGYADAALDAGVAAADSGAVRVSFRADPGPRYRFGSVRVEGAPADLQPLVVKTAAVPRGGLYTPVVLGNAETQLRLLDLFRQVRLKTERIGGSDTLDVLATVSPREPRTVEVSFGYWTDDLVRIGSRWQHRNLFRGGRGLEIHGSASRFLQRAGVGTWWPAVLAARTRGDVGIEVEQQLEDSYDLLSVDLEVGVSYRHSINTSARVGVAISNVTVDAKTDEPGAFLEDDGLLTYLFGLWRRDKADDRLYPKRGSVLSLRGEWGLPGSFSDSHYLLAETHAAGYLAILGNAVLAARIGSGWARPTGNSLDLLPNKRFYAGGASSMRGFRRRKLGPLDDNGGPLGGQLRLEAALELRFPLIWRLYGNLFTDTGQVWARRSEAALSTVEVAVGGGLMFLTPVGAVRADVGHRVTDHAGDQPENVFHLSIGQPF